MANFLWISQTLKESNALNASQCLLKLHFSCLTIYIYFVLNSAKVKKKLEM